MTWHVYLCNRPCNHTYRCGDPFTRPVRETEVRARCPMNLQVPRLCLGRAKRAQYGPTDYPPRSSKSPLMTKECPLNHIGLQPCRTNSHEIKAFWKIWAHRPETRHLHESSAGAEAAAGGRMTGKEAVTVCLGDLALLFCGWQLPVFNKPRSLVLGCEVFLLRSLFLLLFLCSCLL